MPPPGGSLHTPCCDLFSLLLCPDVPSGDIFEFREALSLCACVHAPVHAYMHVCVCAYIHVCVLQSRLTQEP